MQRRLTLSVQPSVPRESARRFAGPDVWRQALPVLVDRRMTLRSLVAADAASLHRHLRTPSVLEFVAPPPDTIEGFRRFIRWTNRQRRSNASVTYGVAPAGMREAVGLIQVWPIEPDYSTAEWGFVLGEEYWGCGVFDRSARLLLDFLFGTVGVKRLEARSVAVNDRANRALAKLGATSEGILRDGFQRGDEWMNQVMWSILADEWARARPRRSQRPDARALVQ